MKSDLPLPGEGGSYVRNPDGSLTRTDLPPDAAAPEPEQEPLAPARKPKLKDA